MKFIDVDTPEVGDLAHHKDGFDARKVTKVAEGAVWIEIADFPFVGPCPLENYTFTRPVEDEPEEETA